MGVGIYRKYIEDFPAELQEIPDWQAFGELLDELDGALIQSITEMGYFYDVERAPDFLLNLIGYELGAQITTQDSPLIKRQKINDAVFWHKQKGTPDMCSFWIERVTGVAPIFTSSEGSGYLAIWESLNNLLPFPNDFMKWESLNSAIVGGFGWGSIQTSGTGDRFIVYIDTQVVDMPAIMLDRLEEVIKYFGAAYIRYHIGYRDPGWHLYRTVY